MQGIASDLRRRKMAVLEWKPEFSVGVTSCDSEHKVLVSTLNSLHDAMKAGNGRTIIVDVIGKLIHYAKTHFAQEEYLMVKAKYPKLAEHKAEHQNFIETVSKFQK